MSFTQNNNNSRVYAPGWFLADNEGCERKTRQIAQSGATTAENGTKYIPMGTIYPSNDANATGIVYEDVDVTTGDMPGSVVLKGTVYEDRLAVTGASYSAASPETSDNPSAKGWYEQSGTSPDYVYTLTTDTTVSSGKTYYIKSDVRMSSAAKTALKALGFKFVDVEIPLRDVTGERLYDVNNEPLYEKGEE